MSKIIIPGWLHNRNHIIRCIKCSCVFRYNNNDIYRGITIPYEMAPRYEVACPECGYPAPAIFDYNQNF